MQKHHAEPWETKKPDDCWSITAKGARGKTYILRVPPLFANSHWERNLLTGELLSPMSNRRPWTFRVNDEELAEWRSDADFYSFQGRGFLNDSAIARSARKTVERCDELLGTSS